MSEEFSYFDLGSGLPLADTDVTITAAEVGFDTEYSADVAVVKLTFTPDEEGAEEQTQLYSIGKAFEPIDQGERLAHTSGKRVKINQQSNYGKWIAAAIHCDGFLDHAREVGLEPDSMELWVGTRWHLTAESFEVRNPSKPNDPPKQRTIILPDVFYGVGDDEEEAAPPVKKAAAKPAGAAKKMAGKPAGAAKKAAAPAPASSGVLDELAAEEGGEELIAQLRELAAGVETHDEFMEQAMDVDGVMGNNLAQKAVMSSKPGSIWADREG